MESPDPSILRDHYAEMSDGELMLLASEAESLEKTARRLLDSELHRRRLAESDVVAFREKMQAESRKTDRARRKRLYRILVGAGGPWEKAYSYWKWATLGAFGTGYMLRLLGCRKPLVIVGGALTAFLLVLPITVYAARRLTPKHKKRRAANADRFSR